jgi:hypothetical protein
MKIEVGKSYINAKGDVVNIHLHKNILNTYVCIYYSYMPNGRIIIGKESPQDLICEVVPEIYERYTLGYIPTQEAFIEKHIKYWTEYEQNDL